MRELRKERRAPTKEWAKIVIPGEKRPLNCTIMNVSTGGAKLIVGKAKVPDQFFLVRKADRSVRPATVRSRSGETVGVALGPPLAPDASSALMESHF